MGVGGLALVGAIVTAASESRPGDDGRAAPTPTVDAGDGDVPSGGPTGSVATDAPSFARDAGPHLVRTAQFQGRAGTLVPMLDGSEVVVLHPPGTDLPTAQVRLLASAWPRGLEDCCRRQIVATPAPASEMLDDDTPVLELETGDPGRALVVDGPAQVLVIEAGDWTVSVVAEAGEPFTTAELDLYGRLLDVGRRGGAPPTVSARPPLVMGDAMAGVRLAGPVSLNVTVFDAGSDGRCGVDDDLGSVFAECALGFQVFGFYDAGSDLGTPDLAVSVARAPGPPAGGPAPGSVVPASSGWSEPVTVAGTRILAGGPGSGIVTGVSETRGVVNWTVDLGRSAFVSPVTVDDVVYVAPVNGSLVALSPVTGATLWTLPLEATQSARPVRAVGGVVGDALVVVPTDFSEAGRSPVVYAVHRLFGRIEWQAELSPGVSLGPWEPVLVVDHVLVSGIAAFDNRDALLVVQALTTDGELAWSHAVEPTVLGGGDAPVVATGSVALVRDGPQAIDAVDPLTGEVAWRHESGDAIGRIEVDHTEVDLFSADGETTVRLDLATGEPVD